MTEGIIVLTMATGVLLGSPGPATLSLAAVGASYGVSKGAPYLFGILMGLLLAMAGAVIGVAAVFDQWPAAKWIIQLLGAAYLFYIAYKIATAPVLLGETAENDIPRFRDGLVLNLLNPKAYAAFFVLFSQFLVPFGNIPASYIITALVCFAVAIVVDSIWLMLGSAIRPLFSRPESARLMRVFFATTIVGATIWTLIRQLT